MSISENNEHSNNEARNEENNNGDNMSISSSEQKEKNSNNNIDNINQNESPLNQQQNNNETYNDRVIIYDPNESIHEENQDSQSNIEEGNFEHIHEAENQLYTDVNNNDELINIIENLPPDNINDDGGIFDPNLSINNNHQRP